MTRSALFVAFMSLCGVLSISGTASAQCWLCSRKVGCAQVGFGMTHCADVWIGDTPAECSTSGVECGFVSDGGGGGDPNDPGGEINHLVADVTDESSPDFGIVGVLLRIPPEAQKFFSGQQTRVVETTADAIGPSEFISLMSVLSGVPASTFSVAAAFTELGPTDNPTRYSLPDAGETFFQFVTTEGTPRVSVQRGSNAAIDRFPVTHSSVLFVRPDRGASSYVYALRPIGTSWGGGSHTADLSAFHRKAELYSGVWSRADLNLQTQGGVASIRRSTWGQVKQVYR